MAKSTRSKVKRSFRAKKREQGVYAATEAARLNRLHQKLRAVTERDAEGDVAIEDAEESQEQNGVADEGDTTQPQTTLEGDGMEVDTGAASSTDAAKRISTHGPRNSRREEWRKAKGMPARPQSRGMNRQGLPAGKRKSGRSHRRR